MVRQKPKRVAANEMADQRKKYLKRKDQTRRDLKSKVAKENIKFGDLNFRIKNFKPLFLRISLSVFKTLVNILSETQVWQPEIHDVKF